MTLWFCAGSMNTIQDDTCKQKEHFLKQLGDICTIGHWWLTEYTTPTLKDVCSCGRLDTQKGGSQKFLDRQINYPFYCICRFVLITLPCSSTIKWLKICLRVTKLKFKCRNTNHEDINSEACLYYKDFCAWVSLKHELIDQIISTTLY